MVEAPVSKRCPACGSMLSRRGVGTGLCPGCLLELALESPSLMAEVEDPGEDGTLVFARQAFSPGQVLGKRYRIRALLGRGGMGEVWRASDLKLRVDVALKALRPQLVEDERALETLRQEVRAARGVVSPNVCRVFDLVEVDGQELVSMEYIDGMTLLDILKSRAPLELAGAREIASQFLAGLEAIHGAGLVHRDVKPENIMRTRSGRVVLMDFGIAKGLAEGQATTVAGTPAYMAPEQTRGEALDARADVFSSGVVLAEMLAPEGLASPEARRKLWEGIHREPPEIADTPWAAVLGKAVARTKEQRFPTASALARALEEVTLRAAGEEHLHPYPGLASFTREDAEYFFGRELEVEEMWKKLARPHLLALIGPSGAGKSSFLRAGLLSVLPTGWGALVATPGERPFTALSECLVPELAGDAEAMKELLRFEESDAAVSVVSRWRRRHDQALLIVDQFEELFTQNPPEVQKRFSELLARLALEADVHVLLAMRDDFLFHCSGQPGLAPIFSELTPLKPLSGAALRRALVQPALKCGYRFEDDALVDEMVGEVEAERGALPLLAFAAARLWTLRDREQGLLTREAHEHIGGVGGALAQHAEATLEAIGHDRIPLVRELFRNLVTSEGTRATRRREELLSVFSDEDRPAGERILATLVDARLLTSYEVAKEEGGEDARQQRIEIIHESLLSNWPRLVRWQTQDADSAQLRDQIRQAARLWQERGRSEDLLWTGTAFDEFRVWRERYPGGLSHEEEAFAEAMAERAGRRRRARRRAVAVVITLALLVIAVTSTLWRRSESARARAGAEELRAESNSLLLLSRLTEEEDLSAALAYATKSLELVDTPEARRKVEEILWRGPTRRVVPLHGKGTKPEGATFAKRYTHLAVSPDGEWLAVSSNHGDVLLMPKSGTPQTVLRDPSPDYSFFQLQFSAEGRLLVGIDILAPGLWVWSVPGGEVVRRIETETWTAFELLGDRIRTWTPDSGNWDTPAEMTIRDRPLAGGDSVEWRQAHDPVPHRSTASHPGGEWQLEIRGRDLLWLEIFHDAERGPYRSELLASHSEELIDVALSPAGDRVFLQDGSGRFLVWTLDGKTVTSRRTLTGVKFDGTRPFFDQSGSWLIWGSNVAGDVFFWDLEGPAAAPPTAVPTGNLALARGVADPAGGSIALLDEAHLSFWSLDGRWSRTIPASPVNPGDLAFTADGRSLVSCHEDGVYVWPLAPSEASGGRVAGLGGKCIDLEVHPGTRDVLVGHEDSRVSLVSLSTGSRRELYRGPGKVGAVAFDRQGARAAMGPFTAPLEDKAFRFWTLETGSAEPELLRFWETERFIGSHPNAVDLEFAPDGALYSGGFGGLHRWDPAAGWQVLHDAEYLRADLSADGSRILVTVGDWIAPTAGRWFAGDTSLELRDLPDGSWRPIDSHGTSVQTAVFDPSGEILVSGDLEGAVRVGPVTGAEPVRLLGHEAAASAVAVSPDGRWVASAGGAEIRLWQMPDLARPRLHTLPRDELLARLHSIANLRAVPDVESPNGWRLEAAPLEATP